jgi:hypothetical protein
MLDALKRAGVEAKLTVKPGAGHGWGDMVKDMGQLADWFDAHLKKTDAGAGADAVKASAKDKEAAASLTPDK